MRKKLLVLSVLAMLFCLNMNVSAQLSILTENFESGMPTGWTVDPASATTPWTVSSSGLTGVTAYGGTNYLSLYTTDQQSATRLVLPLMDASLLTQPEMRFYLMQKARGQNTGYARDTLKVYARNSVTANWSLVDTKSAELSTWTLQTVDLSAFAAGNLQVALEYNFGAGLGIGIDNLFIGDPSVCYTPNNLQVYRITHNSAELMWTAYETAFQFGLKVSTTPLATPGSSTANVFDQTVYFKPYTITGLTPSTTYYFYVSADCGNGDESSWSAAGEFTTKCAPVSTPYSQGFETSDDFTTCWTREFVANGVWTTTPSASTYAPKAYTSYHHSGSSCVLLYSYYYISGQDTRSTQAWTASPELNTTTITDKQISFWAYTSTIDCELRVGVMTDPSDPASFEEVATVAPTVASQWQEFIVPLNGVTATNARYVAFMVDGSDFNKSFYYCVDDVEIGEYRQCGMPQSVAATNLTTNGATISWNSPNGLTHTVVLATASVNPDSVDENDPDVLFIQDQLTDNYIDLTGVLDPATTYYVYVQSDCNAADGKLSLWSDEYVFTTTCFGVNVPVVENFDHNGVGAGQMASCWTTVTSTNGNIPAGTTIDPYIVGGNTTPDGDGKALRLYAYYGGGTTPADSKSAAVMPQFNSSIDTLMLSFSHRSENGNRKMLVGLMSDPSDLSTFTPIDTAFAGSAWKRQTVKLAGYNYGSYIAFLADGDLNQATVTMYVDSVVVDTVQTCLAPLNVRVSNITGSTVDVTMQTLSAADSRVQIQISTGLGSTDAEIDALTFAVDTIVNVADLPVTLSGLQPLTSYNVYAHVACPGNTFSPRHAPVSFTTGCGVFSIPFAESFNNISAFPTCWSSVGATPSLSTAQKVTGKSLYLSSATYVALPNLDLQNGVNGYELSLSYRASSTSGTIEAGVMTDRNDTTTFVSMGVVNATSAATWNNFSANFASYTGAGQTIAFRTTGTSFYIEDVYVCPYSACARPLSLIASNVDTTSFTISWTAGGSETAWKVAIVAAGGDVNNATPVAVTTNSYNFTGLTPATRYDVYVRANCGGADGSSSWSKTTVRTAIVAEGIPFTTNFEDPSSNAVWEILNIQGSNEWVIGSATGNGGNSLYVSNDAGATAGYDGNSASLTLARRLFRFDSDVLYSFDWKCQGESNFDFIRVMVAPENADFSAFSAYTSISTSSVPTGFTAIDGGYLNEQSTWQAKNGVISVPQSGNYYIIFAWRNDGSIGTAPGGVIDNLNLSYRECFVDNINANSAATSAVLNASTDCQIVEIMVNNTTFTPATATGLMLDTVVALPFTLNGLTAQTQYFVAMRGFCPTGDTTAWTSVADFKTACVSVLVDDTTSYTWGFESCTSVNGYNIADCWTRGTNYTSTPYPYVSTTNHTGGHSLYFYTSSSSNYWSYAASPEITGTPLSGCKLDFWMQNTYSGGGIEVGVMSDPEDLSTFVSIEDVLATSTSGWHQYHVSLATAPANARYLAFRAQRTDGTYYYAYIDDIVLSKMPECADPSLSLSASGPTGKLRVAITQNTGSRLPVEVIVTSSATLDSTNALYHQTVNVDTVVVNGVVALQTYYAYARAMCPDGASNWAVASIVVPAPADTLPLTANFEDATANAGWNFADNGGGSSRWIIGTDANACNGGSHGLYVSGNNSTCTYTSNSATAIAYRTVDVDGGNYLVNYDWKCQGESLYDYLRVFLAPTTVAISTITGWSSTTGAPSGCISLDGGSKLNLNGTSWTNYQQTHNIPAGTYNLVFYWHDDSSVQNDPPASVDNVFIGTLKYATITDSVCDGYNYQGNGFNIPSTDITLGGTNSFQRLQNDTMLTLNLTVVPSAETVFNETICSGTTYTLNGFNTGTAGTYHRYLTSAFGCDSIVTLNLIVTQAITTTVTDTICQGDTYTWNGQNYSTTGDYTWTGAAANGCDSIVTLHLTVNPTYHQNASLTIEASEVPYTWNGITITEEGIYTWNGTTAAGCDSIITLEIEVKGVGIDYAEDGMFAISPNPVQRGGNVRLDVTLNEAERKGLVVEVFTSNGKLVNRFEPKEQPMFIKMPDIDGLYMVRLTTGSGRVLYGKVIVK